MICVAMAACGGAACGGNNTEAENNDSTAACSEKIESAVSAESPSRSRSNNLQAAIMDAAQQVCDCGNLDECLNTIIEQNFADYADDEEFIAAVKAEVEKCIDNKRKRRTNAGE